MTSEKLAAALAELAAAREPLPGRMQQLYRAAEKERRTAHRVYETAGKAVARWAARRIRAALHRAHVQHGGVDLDRGLGWISDYREGTLRYRAHVSLVIWLPHVGAERSRLEVGCVPESAEGLAAWCDLTAARIVAWAMATA